MKQVFADTLYWVASITRDDPWHAPTLRAVAALGSVHLVTTEEVLVEFLSAYAGRGEYLRQEALKTIRAILGDEHVGGLGSPISRRVKKHRRSNRVGCQACVFAILPLQPSRITRRSLSTRVRNSLSSASRSSKSLNPRLITPPSRPKKRVISINRFPVSFCGLVHCQIFVAEPTHC